MKTLVVLGPTGVRGRALLEAHAAEGADLRLVCLARRAFTHPGATVVQGDVRDPPAALLEGLDEHVVVHLAVKQVDDDGAGFEATNVVALERLLARLDPRRCRGVVLASSTSVLGRGPHRGVDERAPLAPATPLARSRARAERLLLDWGRARGPGALCVRTRFVPRPDELRRLARLRLLPGSGAQRLSFVPPAELGRSLLALARGLFERPRREAVHLALREAPPLAAALDAVAPRRRLFVPAGPLLALGERLLPPAWRDRLDLLAHDQWLAVDRAIEAHGLTWLDRPALPRLEELCA